MIRRRFLLSKRKLLLGYFKQDIHLEISKGSSVVGNMNQMMEKITQSLYDSHHGIEGVKSSGVHLCSASLVSTTLLFSRSSAEA